MNPFRRFAIVLAAALALPALRLPIQAQWLNYPTPGIPRTADGKPNLSAPAPRTAGDKPDFSGLWHSQTSASGETDKAIHSVKAQPWAEALSKQRKEDLSREDMSILCLPFGPRASMAPDKIIQTPTMLLMLFDDLSYRQVFLDGRSLEKDPNPSWMGYSVGHWDGDTLVIESNGFNDRTWLDGFGHPHSEALRMTERLRRPDFGHLEIERTLEDPKALSQPWVIPIKLEYYPDTEMLEYVCAENERDHKHLVGKASDETKKAVQVAPEILNRYIGTYEYKPPERPNDPILVTITLDNGRLMASQNGGSSTELTPLSETKFFFQGAQLEFVTGTGPGPATEIIAHIVEGDIKVIRKN